MAKDDDKHTIAADYLSQLQRQGDQFSRKDGYSEGESKYKPYVTTSYRLAPLIIRLLVMCGFIAVVGYYLYRAIFFNDGFAIFISIVLLIISVIIFFAVRDASSSTNRKTEN